MSRWNEFTYQSMREVLFDAKPARYSNPVDLDGELVARQNRIQTDRARTRRGHLIGCNLTLMSALLGTPYLPKFDNAILFLEDVGEAIYRVDRMLTQLKLSGHLQTVSASYSVTLPV